MMTIIFVFIFLVFAVSTLVGIFLQDSWMRSDEREYYSQICELKLYEAKVSNRQETRRKQLAWCSLKLMGNISKPSKQTN